LPLAAGALAVALIGNGAYALDRMLGLTYSDGLVGLWSIAMAAGAVLALILHAIHRPKAAPKAA
jgi:hypothetical protein